MDSGSEKKKHAETEKRISRREMLSLAGMLSTAGPPQYVSDKGTISGTITSPWGVVKNADVRATGKSTVSDSYGRYELKELEPGTHSLVVEAPFPGCYAAPQNVEIVAGEGKTVDVYLDFKKTLVEGHVYDSNEKPIVGATISGVLCGKEAETTSSDEKGYFKFDRANPGAQFVRVNAKGHMGETRDFTAQEAASTTLEFHLIFATCNIQGTVSDKNGKPLRSEVYLSKNGIITQKTWTDAETGHYVISVLPGIYDILANATDYLSEGWRGEVSTDTRVDLSLAKAPPPMTARTFSAS